ncbi:MAG TPA: response regulator [Stellaceae bacterium]|nr:response regulator [Stellaceae bacterium]
MARTEPINILLVDDQREKLLTYQAILEELGETLITANSAQEAFGHLLKQEIAIILVDVIMPELDGFELARMIRDHPRFQTTAIIFVSAMAVADVDLLKGYEHGGVDYVSVPVVPELLRAKVRIFAELYRKTRELKLLNTELERRVEERTAELARANAELERRVEERTREREVALAQVHEMQKLESLGQLTGGVAHDFNNLLMAILGNLEVLSRRSTADELTMKRLLDGAIRAAERGTALTRRMLAFARRQELRPERVDVARHVFGMVEMLRRSIGPTIEISAEFEEELPPVRVDPSQLELAILNLSLNARDAMPEGGRLRIGARHQEVTGSSPLTLAAGRYVCIAVTDGGLGMDEATLKRAPEPFFTTKEIGKGTGLGLSMVYGLATQSGGLARIMSGVGSGTTVEIWLPIAEADIVPLAATSSSPTPRATRSGSILLVDDDPLVTEGTVEMLEYLGHSVTIAASGAEALTVMHSDAHFDLVITDYAMPGMTGLVLAEHIRKLKPEIPIILATGYAETPAGDHGVQTIRLGKPYRLEKLSTLLNGLLSRESTALAGARS